MTGDPLDGWDDELTDWTNAAACDSGQCLRVEVTGGSVRLWESSQPGIEVVTTLVSWQQWQDKARAEERARVVAALGAWAERCHSDGEDAEADHFTHAADLIRHKDIA